MEGAATPGVILMTFLLSSSRLLSVHAGSLSRISLRNLDTLETIYQTATAQMEAENFLKIRNAEMEENYRLVTVAEWDYVTNITKHNKQRFVEETNAFSTWYRQLADEAKRFDLIPLRPDLRRQLEWMKRTTISKNPDLNRLEAQLKSTMLSVYGSTKACLSNATCTEMEPGLAKVMATSKDPEVLQDAWVKWRDAVGPRLKDNYTDFVDLLNQEAMENGFANYAEYWRIDQFPDTPDLDTMLDQLWEEIEPLYLQLHAYVRRKLREYYGSNVVGTQGTIPAHILGNMWAQNWPIAELVIPFPEVDQETQIEARLKERYDVMGMFKEAEKFYTSMGLFPMTSTFWSKSMLVKPEDRDVVCHASSFDLNFPGDFRMKMCATVTLDNFVTVHHEMGHVEYFMAYSKQPNIFRHGANDAFHESIGDTIQLSAMSSTHMKKLHLLPSHQSDLTDDNDGEVEGDDEERKRNDIDDDIHAEDFLKRGDSMFLRVPRTRTREEKSAINKLMSMALLKVAFLPFGFLVDKWRWAVMAGEITQENLNKEWWKLRLKYQGIVSPVPRSEKDFDPAAKFHIPSNSPYMCYFVSHIQQFQMYQALCQEAGHRGDLHLCDFYGSTAAGTLLKSMLSLGASRPWQEQLQTLTGKSTVSAHALIEYFRPLYDWLKEDNARHGEVIGWKGASINWET